MYGYAAISQGYSLTLLACCTPVLLGGSFGGANLSSLIGGAAKGIPSHCVMPLVREVPSNVLYDRSTNGSTATTE